MNASRPSLLWDIFCKVIDNHGDLGVCWRFSAQLAASGHRVRLWVDDPSALPWMAPCAMEGDWPGVQVLPWTQTLPKSTLAALPPADVWVEAFGCDLPPEFIEHFTITGAAGAQPPVWINLEYLSAESYVERVHGLPSPVMRGPAAGMTKWFFYPGFTSSTGGLMQEPDFVKRQAQFDRGAWLSAQGIDWHGERLISLFCYEPDALTSWLQQLAQGNEPTRLLVTPGRANAGVRAVLDQYGTSHTQRGEWGSLAVSYLPYFTQTGFDELLWTCDLNFVRGEDSVVRALLTGKPFVWHIYPQDDDAHHAKLKALMDWLNAPASMRHFHNIWNGIVNEPLPAPNLSEWQACVTEARERLLSQGDLTTQLTQFVTERR